ncbi:hypothetical protein Tco_0151373 [Tanacetum coccineum]
MNTSQDIKMQMVDDNVGNRYGNGNVETTPTEGNGNGINEEETGIQSTQEEFEFMAAADAYKETERVKVNYTSEDTLQQASTSGTQSDNAPAYDSDRSTEVPKDENCYDHDMFNMITHEVQYTDLQTELDRTKEKLENCIIKKEKEYAILWNNWYTKSQLGDLKGKSSDTQCTSNTLDPVSQKLKDENVSLEFQVRSYAKENEHLKTIYKNMFDSIKVTQDQTRSIIDSLQKQLYENEYYVYKAINLGETTFFFFFWIKLYSVTPFPKSSVLPEVDKTNALSKPVTSNLAPSTRELKVVQTVNVIAPRIFRPSPSKTSRVDNVVPNKPVKTSVRIKPITVSLPNVIHKKQSYSDSNGFSTTRVNNTAKTRRPHPRSNSNTDRVPSKSKSSCLSNNVEKIEENHRNSQIPKNQKHMSSECNNITLAIRNAKSKIVCVMCKKCLLTANHDKHKANAKISKELGSKGSLASSRPSKPRTCLRWIPTGRIFAMCGKLTASSNTENKSEKSMCENASTSNPSEPSSKGFPISTSFLGRLSRLRKQHTSIYPIDVL